MDNQNSQPAVAVTSPSPGAAAATPSATPASTGAGASPWGDKFKSAEDAWKAYQQLESKLGEQGNMLGEYRKAYEALVPRQQEYEKAVQAWDQWYKKDIAPNWNDIQKFLATPKGQKVVQQQAQQTVQQNAQDWSAGWENLSPQQQAERLQRASIMEIGGALKPALEQWASAFQNKYQQDIQAKEAYFNNYLNLYRRVMDMKLANPTLDIDTVLDQAVKVLSGQQDPIELGKTLATMNVDRESYAKQVLENARKDWEQELKNKELASVNPVAGGEPPVFKVGSAAPGKRGLASMREDVAKQILEKHGPGVFRG
jgi:hypothetical protein